VFNEIHALTFDYRADAVAFTFKMPVFSSRKNIVAYEELLRCTKSLESMKETTEMLSDVDPSWPSF